MGNQIDEAAIRQRVVKRIRQRMLFFLHLALGFPALLIAGATPNYDYGAKLVFYIWFITFTVHALKRFYDWQVERAVRREIDREMQLQASGIKQKNAYTAPRLRLADDGELVETDDAEGVEGKVKRRRA